LSTGRSKYSPFVQVRQVSLLQNYSTSHIENPTPLTPKSVVRTDAPNLSADVGFGILDSQSVLALEIYPGTASILLPASGLPGLVPPESVVTMLDPAVTLNTGFRRLALNTFNAVI